jgi:hypothetical protein
MPFGTPSTPLVIDLDGDGEVEVFAASDRVYAWNLDGSGYLNGYETFYNPAGEALFLGPLAAADLDGELPLELVVADQENLYVLSIAGKAATLRWSKPVPGFLSSPVITDLDDDGSLDVSFLSGGGSQYAYAWESGTHRRPTAAGGSRRSGMWTRTRNLTIKSRILSARTIRGRRWRSPTSTATGFRKGLPGPAGMSTVSMNRRRRF